MDARLGLSGAARALGDERQRGKVRHDMASMLAQRIYGLCLGWADVRPPTRCAMTWRCDGGRQA